MGGGDFHTKRLTSSPGTPDKQRSAIMIPTIRIKICPNTIPPPYHQCCKAAFTTHGRQLHSHNFRPRQLFCRRLGALCCCWAERNVTAAVFASALPPSCFCELLGFHLLVKPGTPFCMRGAVLLPDRHPSDRFSPRFRFGPALMLDRLLCAPFSLLLPVLSGGQMFRRFLFPRSRGR